MVTIAQIPNSYLRDLIQKSARFSMLSVEDQQQQLNYLINAPQEVLENKYIPFFESENQQEIDFIEKKQPEIHALIQKITEVKRSLKVAVLKGMERKSQAEEENTAEELLKEINEF